MRKFLCLLLFVTSSSLAIHAEIITGFLSPGSLYPGGTDEAIYDLNNDGQFDFQVEVVFLGGGDDYILVFTGVNGTMFETTGGETLLGYNADTPLGGNTYESTGNIEPFFTIRH